MKENIHPKYKEVTVTCSCGNVFVTSSTIDSDTLHIDVCAKCHPFYTGKQKIVDTGGRVERFKQKYTHKAAIEKPKAAEKIAVPKTAKTKKPVKKVAKTATPKAASKKESSKEVAKESATAKAE